MNKLLFVSPRIALQKGDFLGSGIPYWPLEMVITASFAIKQGHEVDVLDLFGENPKHLEDFGDHFMQGVPLSSFSKRIHDFNPDLIVVYGLSYMSHGEICRILKFLKGLDLRAKRAVLENSQAVTAFALPSVKESLFSHGADALICGEPYWNWGEILLTIDSQTVQAKNVLLPNLSEQTVERKTQLNGHYPIPAWELIHLENYWSLPYSHGPKTKKFLPIYTSRGCPYPCDFCVVPSTNERKWRGRAARDVVEEMRVLKERFGVVDFQIEDLNPTVNTKRMDELCEILIQEKLGIHFYIVSGTKAETIRIEQLEKYYQAGCRYISISPESGSTKVMKAIGKPFNYEHGVQLVEKCRNLGIATQACFIVGHPAETEEDFKLSKNYLEVLLKAGLTEAAIFIVSPFAGSQLSKANAIPVQADQLASFTPKGREDYHAIESRRSELIRTFFLKKLPHLEIWQQGLRALLGVPKTKMENLPKRMIYILWLNVRFRLQKAMGHSGIKR